MSTNSNSDKVIVINAKTLKILRTLTKAVLSIIAAILCTFLISFYIGYYEYNRTWGYLLNNYALYKLVSFLIFFFGISNIKSISKAFKKLWQFNQNYIMRTIGVEIFTANIYSLISAAIVFFISSYISHSQNIWGIPTALYFAVPTYILVMHFLTRRKIKYIQEIANGILEISKGNLDYKVKEKGADELKILAENINIMCAKLKIKIEEERKAEQTKNELITNVSHDLKTPLTTIIGYLTLVKDKKFDDEITLDNYIERAYSKSLRLKKLIEDLFEYTKISNGVIKVNKTKVNLVELMEQLLGEMSVIAKQNNLSFEKYYSNSEIYVDIDSDLMARTFENILSNAIKYSYKELNSKIYVSTIQQDNKVTISIENHGDTIPTEILPLLFERFYRVDASRNSKISGSGLGLAIAKTIVELHDGTIHAESEANRIKISVVL